jgi:hypothetical protein
MKTHKARNNRVWNGGKFLCECDTPSDAQRLAALLNSGEADKARLDWLENCGSVQWKSASGIQRDGNEGSGEWVEVDNGEHSGTGSAIRSAIDAALHSATA